MIRLPKYWLKALSALSINISAAWFGVVIIAPNFWPLVGFKPLLLLTADIFAGTVFLIVTVRLERRLEAL